MPTNFGNFEGVVAVHAMTNGLVAAAYTNGLLRVIRLPDCSIVH